MARKILIADDNPKVLENLHALLLNQGYRVLAVENGEKALDCANDYRPHLLILDITMPGKDGYQVCHQLKSNPESAHIPVILTFSENEPFDPSQAKRAGASRCIPKSIDPDTLSTILESLWINLGIPDDKDEEVIEIDEIEPFDEEDEKIPKILAGTASVNSSTGTHYIFQIAVEQVEAPVQPITQDLPSKDSEDLLGIAEEVSLSCSECGSRVQPQDVICISCGAAIGEPIPKAAVKCSECGAFAHNGDIFCLQCGTALSP